jgi:lysophospholipase L1-like esterase
MNMGRCSRVVAVSAATVIAAGLCAGAGAHALAAVASAAKPNMRVLVMGDSYSAGNGAGDYSGAKGCYRSGRNYAQDFAAIIRATPYSQPVSVTNVACSGAVTADFFNSKSGRPPELNAVTGGYDLIFLTIGGNDVDFKYIVATCLIAGDGALCNALLSNAEKLIANGTMKARVTKVLKGIRTRANPLARIVLLGYPFLEGDTGYTLPIGSGLKAPLVKVGQRLHAIGVAADALAASIVNTLNAAYPGTPFAFVSVHKLFGGPPYHGLYASKTNPNRWMVQPVIDTALGSTWYHPNPTGWREEAQLLARTGSVPKSPRPVIVATLPIATVGGPYTAQFATADDRAGTWMITAGKLPPGLSRTGQTISGKPTTAGAYKFSLSFTDADGRTAVATATISVRGAASISAVEAPLPGDAASSSQAVNPGPVACASASACLVVDMYLTAARMRAWALITGSGASWTATEAPLPEASDNNPHVNDAACASDLTCAVVGYYLDASAHPHAWLVTGSGTSWTTGAAPLPPDAGAGQVAVLNSVTCVSTCVALGYYVDSAGNGQGLILTGSGTSWTATREPLPAGGSDASAGSAACPSATTCVALGSYVDASGTLQGLLLTGSGTSWKAVKAPRPADAVTTAEVRLGPVACRSAAQCVVIGSYTPYDGPGPAGMLITGSGTSWKAIRAPLPSGDTAWSEVADVACKPAECVAIGFDGGVRLPMMLTWSGTSWTVTKAPEPANLYAVACPSTSACVAVGYHGDDSGNFYGMVFAGAGTSWTVTETPLPANATVKYAFAELDAVACSSASACVVSGIYDDSANNEPGMILTGNLSVGA